MAEQTVVSVKDIEAIYGKDFITQESLQDRGYRTAKVNTGMMDDDIVVTVVTNVGPYTTLRIPGLNHSNFIMPTEKVVLKQVVKAIDRFKPILDVHFPNRWYLDGGRLYLYFPELKLTNSIGTEHTIYDLVTMSLLDPTYGNISYVQGKRYSFSKSELVSGYCHSHLSKFDSVHGRHAFSNFCRGGSSPFDKLVSGLNKANSAKELEVFLIQLEQYLQWESLEGKPHIAMNSIGTVGGIDGYTEEDLMEEDLHNMAKSALKKLTDASCPLFASFNGRIMLDHSLNPTWFYENVERPLVEEFADEIETVNWDTMAGKYISITVESNLELPMLDSTDHTLISKFGINPRIIQEDVEPQSTTVVKRLGINHIVDLIRKINDYLYNGEV